MLAVMRNKFLQLSRLGKYPNLKFKYIKTSEAQFLRWISGGFFIEKHLTQGDFALLNSPPSSSGETVNFAPPILQSPWLARGPTLGES